MAAAVDAAFVLLQEESEEFAEIAHGEPPIVVVDDDAIPLAVVLSPGCFFGFLVRGPVDRNKAKDREGVDKYI